MSRAATILPYTSPFRSVAPPGVSAIGALRDGKAHVVQSALSQAFTPLNEGLIPPAVHFAQVNEMDGFFLTGREADPDFSWRKLEGAEVVMFKGGQPNAMFRYACHKAGIDFAKIRPITPGGAADIDRAFRDGQGLSGKSFDGRGNYAMGLTEQIVFPEI